MSKVDLYYFIVSPYSRSVLYTAKLLDIKPNLKVINLLKEEQKSDEYAKVNPHKKVPAIVDGTLSLSESKAIMIYLFNKYAQAKHDYLYPKDLKKRAKVDQFLYYSSGTLSTTLLGYFAALFFGKRKATEEEINKVNSALNDLENFYFKGTPYLFGDNPTLGDLDLLTLLNQLEFIEFDFSKFQKITKFLTTIKKFDWFKGYDTDLKKVIEPVIKDYKSSLKA